MAVRFGLGLLIPLAIAVVVGGPQSLAVGSLGSGVERFTNSVHEPLVAITRIALGENPDVAVGPLDDLPRTVRVIRGTTLWSATGGSGTQLGNVDGNQSVIAIASAQAGWYHILDPHTRDVGFISSDDTRPFGRVRDVEADAVLTEIQQRLQTANTLLRTLGWALFIPSVLVVLWKIRSVRDGVGSTATVMGLFLVFLGAWLWPWYLVWPLALGALTRDRDFRW